MVQQEAFNTLDLLGAGIELLVSPDINVLLLKDRLGYLGVLLSQTLVLSLQIIDLLSVLTRLVCRHDLPFSSTLFL